MVHSPQPMPGFRWLVAGVLLAFFSLFVINTFIGSQKSVNEAEKYFTPAEVERGLQYSYERKLLGWCSIGFQLALLTALVCSPWSRRLTDMFGRWTGGRWLPTLILVGATYTLLSELLSLPLGLVRLEHSRAWNMTERPVSSWMIDWGKSLGLEAVQGLILLLGLYGLMWFFPRWWWLWATAFGAAFGILYAFVMPELIDPLFYKVTPLADQYHQARIKALAVQAGIVVDNVKVIDASSRGRHTNAYFTGYGSTRRVVLYDTLLRSHNGIDAETAAGVIGLLASSSCDAPWGAAAAVLDARSSGDDELETVFAHEIGHWRHDHIVKGIALASVGLLVGMFLLSRILHWAVGRRPFYLSSPTDPAGLPLILLLSMLATWLTMPVQNGISRYFERQADAASLELAQKPEAFIEAEKRMARQNLSNVAPSPLNVWLFSTHPPTVERIEMAVEWGKGK